MVGLLKETRYDQCDREGQDSGTQRSDREGEGTEQTYHECLPREDRQGRGNGAHRYHEVELRPREG